MKADTPARYTASARCTECDKGIDPHQARTSRAITHEVDASGVSEGVPLCRRCLDRYRRDSLERGWFVE